MFSYPWPLANYWFFWQTFSLICSEEGGGDEGTRESIFGQFINRPSQAQEFIWQMFKFTRNILLRLEFLTYSQFTMMTLLWRREDPNRAKMHKISHSDIYMIIPVNLWNSQMTQVRRCGHKMFARVCEFRAIWLNFIPVPHIYDPFKILQPQY